MAVWTQGDSCINFLIPRSASESSPVTELSSFLVIVYRCFCKSSIPISIVPEEAAMGTWVIMKNVTVRPSHTYGLQSRLQCHLATLYSMNDSSCGHGRETQNYDIPKIEDLS